MPYNARAAHRRSSRSITATDADFLAAASTRCRASAASAETTADPPPARMYCIHENGQVEQLAREHSTCMQQAMMSSSSDGCGDGYGGGGSAASPIAGSPAIVAGRFRRGFHAPPAARTNARSSLMHHTALSYTVRAGARERMQRRHSIAQIADTA